MTELRIESLVLPAAELGAENPWPVLNDPGAAAQKVKVDSSVPESARAHLGYGCEAVVLPYRVQDQYGRGQERRGLPVAVLENEHLRATFLLTLGGRLYSLRDKGNRRELVYTNPVFQPANLAVRNAWFSGGVEWNCGVPGHSPLTCSPVFAARVIGDDGAPILRLYEFERIRRAPYQLDFSLPPGSRFLLVYVRVCNPHDRPVPMYWWSNIAYAQRPGTRVIVPATQAYNFAYAGEMRRIGFPDSKLKSQVAEADFSYPEQSEFASDFFFDIPEGKRPWIAAVDEGGHGLVQTSTRAQRGRKLFVWGTSAGGKRWQEFLSVPGQAYFEIQAGVAKTQYESFPMAAQSEISWMEAYGAISGDPSLLHAKDFSTAQREVESQLAGLLPSAQLDARLAAAASLANRPAEELLRRGSGYGALEASRRYRSGETPFAGNELMFDDPSLGPEQAPWISLLHNGILPEADPLAEPSSYMTQAEWLPLLEASATHPSGDHWLTHLHLGVMHHASGRADRARQHWQKSLTLKSNPWAMRNLAVDAQFNKDAATAAELYLAARCMLPESVPLTVETLSALLAGGHAAKAREMFEEIPMKVRNHGRVRVLEARLALATNDPQRALRLLSTPFEVPDLREGELLLSDLWGEIHRATGVEAPPVPKWLDFRMAGR